MVGGGCLVAPRGKVDEVSILSDSAVLVAMDQKRIVIDPFDRARLGSNSYDVALGPRLLVYETEEPILRPDGRVFFPGAPTILDVRKQNPTMTVDIPESGIVLHPGQLYLGSTIERTESHDFVPVLCGKSSLGRLGLSVHVTAGFGDVGFCGAWTLELMVVRPLRIYAGMPVAQIAWHTVEGLVLRPYGFKPGAKYANQSADPVASEMWRNFDGLKPDEWRPTPSRDLPPFKLKPDERSQRWRDAEALCGPGYCPPDALKIIEEEQAAYDAKLSAVNLDGVGRP